MQAVVVTFDRLATTALGCYGNEWIETPHFDRLASQSVVFDRHFAEHVGDSAGMGWSTGCLPTEASARPFECASAWSALLEQAGVELHLVNEFDVLPWSMALRKTSRTLISNRHESDPKPDEIPFACLVKAAGELLAAPRGEASRIVWLHSAGVPEPWLPPEGFATLYFDEYAERGCDMASVTRDNWGTHPAAYAGYVSLLDHWLGELVTVVEAAAKSEPTLLIVTAARGGDWMRLLTEHAMSMVERVGYSATDEETSSPVECPESQDEPVEPLIARAPFVPRESVALADSITRTPLLLRRFDDGTFDPEFAGTRSNRLVQTADLSATLLDYFQLPVTSVPSDGRSLLSELAETQPPREAVCFTDGTDARGIRTAEWSCLVEDASSSDESEAAAKLFAKPEDIWEANDVSGQQRDVAASLVARLNEILPSANGETHRR